MALKIALISPAGPLYRHRGGIFSKSLRYSPLTLITLAAYVPPELNATVEIFDEGIQELPGRLGDGVEADLVAMTVITGTAPRAYQLADRFRARSIPVVLGGPHITLIPEDAAPHADAIVTGYAEHTWPELLNDFTRDSLKPRYEQANLDLSGLPLPRRDLLKPGAYITTSVFEATRGCRHACEFCVVPAAWGRKPFQKPVEDVVRDIQSTGATKAIFIDLNLIADIAYARRLFEALIPLGIRWFGLVTVLLQHDTDLLELMARSGCSGLLVGLESINQRGLNGIRKKFNQTQDFDGFVSLLHRYRITLMGTFVFGLDEDTPEVFEETARFAIDANIDLPRFAILTPFPGTALYQRLNEQDRILTRDWSLYDGQHVVFQPASMTVQELAEGHEQAWKKVYSVRSIFKRLAGSRLQLPINITANIGYRFYARNLHSHYNCDWIIGQQTGGLIP
jgi:radical SAM superfamily enzyme YgiQ (UPF0313 family)